VAVDNGFLDRCDVLLAILVAVLLHGGLLFFFDGTRPDLNIVDFLGLVEFKGLSVFLQQVFVVGHNAVVVEITFLSLKVLDSFLSDQLDAANRELSKDFPGALLLLDVKSFQNIVDLTELVGLDFFLFELALAVIFLLRLLVLPVIKLSIAITVQIVLRLPHRLPNILDLPHFIVQLALDLLEDPDALLSDGALLLDFHEDILQFVAEVNQILMDLGHLVEGDGLLGVVGDGHDETESIALI